MIDAEYNLYNREQLLGRPTGMIYINHSNSSSNMELTKICSLLTKNQNKLKYKCSLFRNQRNKIVKSKNNSNTIMKHNCMQNSN